MFLMFRKLLNPHYERKITMISRCLLLACVFETFTKESMKSFELNPVHCLSTPGYTWDAKKRFTYSC